MFDVDAEKFRLAYAFTSAEESRYYLRGVAIESSPLGGVTLTATDGSTLLSIHDATGALDGPAVIVRLDKAPLSACRNKPRDPHYAADGSEWRRRLVLNPDGAALVRLADGTPVAIQPECLVDGTFPDWRRVMPYMGGASVQQSFDAGFLGRFDEVAAGLGVPGHTIRTTSPAMGAPALVQFLGDHSWRDDVVGVIMPRTAYDDVPAALPAFVKRGPVATDAAE